MKNTFVVEHPVVQGNLAQMRQPETSPTEFRHLMSESGHLMGLDVVRDLNLSPLEVALISVMRSGQGLLDGMQELLPAAPIGHIGLYRDPLTFVAIEYYFKAPADLKSRDCIILDPLLATGHSFVAAVDRLKEKQPRSIHILCLLSCPEGIEYLHRYHPEVTVFTASIDSGLDDRGFILPGLGDVGERLFGTA